MKQWKLALALVLAAAAPAAAQDAPAPGPAGGDVAPSFEIAAATRFGELTEPFRLADYKGSTVVLAFFPRARTKG